MDPTLTDIRKKTVGKTVKEIHFKYDNGEIRGMNIVFVNGGSVWVEATSYQALKVEI